MIRHLKQFWNEERSLTTLLFLLVAYVFVVTPFISSGHTLELLGIVIFALLLLAGLLTMARQRAAQVFSGIFVLSSIGVRIARVVFGFSGLLAWDALFSILSVIGMIFVVLWQVYREGPVTGHRVRGAIAAYLLIAVMFAHCYAFMAALLPGSFQLPAWASIAGNERGEMFFYFSVVALTTVGFGDITAIHPFARSLVMVEALIGQLYPAILIARLVTLEIETRRSKKG